MIESGRRITNAAKLIDFFVHDILDYAVLKGKKQNFSKNIKIFNIRDSIDQVIEILQDKAQMKNIQIDTKFNGFLEYENDSGETIMLAKTD